MYTEHYAHVRSVCPPERLLEFRLGKDGWAELCGFLGKEAPSIPYPKVNDTQAFIDVHASMMSRATWMALEKTAALLIPALAIGAAVVFSKRLPTVKILW